MARYSIDETTLTALGDAVRSHAGETEIRPVPYECAVQSANATGFGEENIGGPYDPGLMVRQVTPYTFPGATTITVKLGGKGEYDYYIVRAASGVFTDPDSFLTSGYYRLLGYDHSKNGYYLENEATFTDTDSITIYENLWQVAGQKGCGYYLEIRAYDADGNPVPYFIEEEVKKTMTPERMVTEISNINKPNILARDFVDRTVTKVTAEDLEGVTVIGYYAFSQCARLEELELPDTVTTLQEMCVAYTKLHELVLPPSVYYIHNKALDYLGSTSSGGVTVKILKDDDIVQSDRSIGGSTMALSNIKEILVPGKLLDAYKTNVDWSKMTDLFKPYDEWTGELSKSASVLAFNSTEDITLSLVAFDYVPEVNITTDAPVDISNINVTTEAITFTMTSQSTEGEGTITIQVTRADGFVIEKTVKVRVLAEFTPSSYTVTPLEIIPYTFALNDAGYYESNNQKQPSSEALCRVDISNSLGQTVVFECINFAETNYDYGRLGNVNQEYAANAADTSYYANFKGKQMSTVQEISYTDAVGDCFIYVSFKKDTSGDNNNDSLQFKIRFE